MASEREQTFRDKIGLSYLGLADQPVKCARCERLEHALLEIKKHYCSPNPANVDGRVLGGYIDLALMK